MGDFNPYQKAQAPDLKPNQCFVLMPFSEDWSDRIWGQHLMRIVTDCDMECIRADDLYKSHILNSIWQGIQESRVIIADITGKNANVMYELGLAHALKKDVIILTQSEQDIPFDLQQYRYLLYQDNSDGYAQLETEIPRYLKELLASDLYDNFDKSILDDEVVVVFLSAGGTCRCAIANVILRQQLLAKRQLESLNTGLKITPVSAGIMSANFEFMSPNARQVIQEKMGHDVATHRSIMAGFDLFKRADLILPFESRFFTDIPEPFQPKATLFSAFFGAQGDIPDPYPREMEEYRIRFDQIHSAIVGNVDAILEFAQAQR